MNVISENEEILEYELDEENEQEPLARYQINSYMKALLVTMVLQEIKEIR